jgi:diguanylate cyclase (GGDEF)-like protein/PAS domain S-box-containing protein
MNAPDPAHALLAGRLDGTLPLLEQLLTRTGHPTIVTDARRRVLWVNQAFVERTGYTLADMAGKTPGSVLQCDETDPAEVQRLRAALDAGQRITTRLRNRARNGERYWVELDIHPFGPPGAPPTGFIAAQPELASRDAAAERLRAVLETAAAGVVVQDASGAIVDGNPAAERLLGLSHAQLIGVEAVDPRWRVIDGDGQTLPADQHPAMRTLRSGEPLRNVLMGVELPDGDRRWLSVNTALLPRDDGAPWLVCSFADVTARRELELKLKDEWQLLTTTLNGTRTATWEWNVSTGVVRFNERWAEIIGYTRVELEPLDIETWRRHTHPDDVVDAQAQLERHFAGTLDHYDIELRMRHRDGSWRWVHARGRLASRCADGAPLLMLGTHEDIHARKSAAIAAAEAYTMLHGLFELAPVGIGLIDLQTLCATDYNQALCDMLGYRRDELLAPPLNGHLPGKLPGLRERNLAEARQSGRYGPCEASLQHRDGHAVDVLLSGTRVVANDGRPYVWSIIQDISQRKAMERGLRTAAEQDRLTGLPNRSVLMQRLEHLAERARGEPGFRFALLFLDFDRFKLINDTLGHEAGDELLVALGQRLRGVLSAAGPDAVSAGSMVARFGGDEFVYVAAGIENIDEARGVADRLQVALAVPYRVKGHDLHSTASIGIALGEGPCAVPHELLRNADTAMYEAKRTGRRNTVVFDHEMHARLTRALRIEAGLRSAVQRGEFSLVYQPIVDLETGQMSSVEALLRWHSPEIGVVPPNEFIPLAEESGQIIGIGEWVLRSACKQWMQWQRQDTAAAPAGMSVNLSRVQMALGNRLLLVVRSALEDAAMPASALQLEITEREAMKDPAGARELMIGLSALGVRLAMDDFGTGTSSLGCLRDYPFDTIKIDKTFVTDLGRDPHVLAVAHATVNVIENLGMVSVAEGIEDPAEVAMLQAMGCRYGQGYFFARPMAGDKLLAAMAPQAAIDD